MIGDSRTETAFYMGIIKMPRDNTVSVGERGVVKVSTEKNIFGIFPADYSRQSVGLFSSYNC